MNAKREKRGPYAGSPSYKAPYRVTLDDTTADTMRALGNGNLSAGIRLAAAFVPPRKIA